ncbi:flagellar biosynthetic protein FliO [Velocimicrobium porci]|uniref:Flagellar protein n=1 Tax=Velocimicrobium porci TaxID=2606634 RepID=A0A6L5XVZ6_9FIRM|nr:flagellar biosynthetic protein FliO [Velocimicrobium porci]MSS63000.1 flagellar biosynthetic protein FliO [Velocimicrobium porci]
MYLTTTGLTRVESLFNLFGILLVFLFILGLSYLVTKFIGKSNLLQQKNKNIQIIETYKIAPNKYIQIVRIGEKYLALGIGKEEIEFLTEIPNDQLLLESFSNQSPDSPELFKDILAKVGKKSMK